MSLAYAQTPRHRVPKPSYPFPELDTASIVTCLENLDISLTEQDIRKPNPNTAFRLFETLGDKLMSVQFGKYTGAFQDEDVLNEMLEDLMDHPELHQNSLPLLNFFHHWSRLMIDIGVPGFSLMDWLKPDGKRLQVLLSGIINFARFRDVNLAVFEELTERSEQYLNSKDHLLAKNQELKAQIEEIRQKMASEESNVEEIKTEASTLNSELKKMKAKGDEVNAEVVKLKQTRTEYQDKVQNAQLLLEHGKQECNRLRSRIVHNPEQIKKTIADMNENIQHLRDSISSGETKVRDLDSKVENLNLLEQDLFACVKLMNDCSSEQQQLEEELQKVTKERDAVERKQTELRDLTMKENQMKRQEASSEDKLNRMQQQLMHKRDQLEEKLQKVRQEWEQFSGESDSSQAQIGKIDATISETRQKISQHKHKHEIEMNTMYSDFEKLKTQVSLYVQDLKKMMASEE